MGDVEPGAEEAVEVVDGAECGDFIVGEGDGEEPYLSGCDMRWLHRKRQCRPCQ